TRPATWAPPPPVAARRKACLESRCEAAAKKEKLQGNRSAKRFDRLCRPGCTGGKVAVTDDRRPQSVLRAWQPRLAPGPPLTNEATRDGLGQAANLPCRRGRRQPHPCRRGAASQPVGGQP